MLTSAYKVDGWGQKTPEICLRDIRMVPNALLAKSTNFRCVGKGGKERSSISRNLFGAHRKAQGFLRSIGFYVCLPHLIRTSKQAKVSEI